MSEYIWSFLSFILSPTSPLNTFEYANGSPYRNLDFVLWLAPGLDLGHASLKAQVFHERLTLESMCETALYATPADDLNTCLLQLKSDQSSLRQMPLPTGDFVMRITTIPLPLYPPPPPSSLFLSKFWSIFWLLRTHLLRFTALASFSLQSQQVLLFVLCPSLSLCPRIRRKERVAGMGQMEMNTRHTRQRTSGKYQIQSMLGDMFKPSVTYSFWAVQIC